MPPPRTSPRSGAGRRRTHERVPVSVPGELRQQIDRWAGAWIARKFSSLLQLRAADPGPYNYPVEVFSEWRGKSFYINAKYRTPSGRPEDDFIVRRARMTLTGFGRFDLAYFRHTDRWFIVFRALTVSDCLEHLEGNEIFWPV